MPGRLAERRVQLQLLEAKQVRSREMEGGKGFKVRWKPSSWQERHTTSDTPQAGPGTRGVPLGPMGWWGWGWATGMRRTSKGRCRSVARYRPRVGRPGVTQKGLSRSRLSLSLSGWVWISQVLTGANLSILRSTNMWDTDQTSISALPPEKVVSRSKLTFRHVLAEWPQPTCLGELHSEGSGGAET